MPKLLIFFGLCVGFGLLFQLLVAPQAQLQLNGQLVKIKVSDLIIGLLLISNFVAIMLLLWRKRN